MKVHIQRYHPFKIGFLSRSCNNRRTRERNNLLFVQGANAFTLVKNKPGLQSVIPPLVLFA